MDIEHKQYFRKRKVYEYIEIRLKMLLKGELPPQMITKVEKDIVGQYELLKEMPDGKSPPMYNDVIRINETENKQIRELFNQILEKHSVDNILEIFINLNK